MSFVSIIQTEKFITVVTDGQVTGNNGRILQKDYKKYRKIAPKQYIAFAGRKDYCERLLEYVPFKEQGYCLEQAAQEILSIISHVPIEEGKILISIGGLNENSQLVMYKVSNQKEAAIEELKVTGEGNLSYMFLCADADSLESSLGVDLENLIKHLLNQTGFNTSNKTLRAQKALNNFVEKVDDSVNKITFDLTIKQ